MVASKFKWDDKICNVLITLVENRKFNTKPTDAKGHLIPAYIQGLIVADVRFANYQRYSV